MLLFKSWQEAKLWLARRRRLLAVRHSSSNIDQTTYRMHSSSCSCHRDHLLMVFVQNPLQETTGRPSTLEDWRAAESAAAWDSHRSADQAAGSEAEFTWADDSDRAGYLMVMLIHYTTVLSEFSVHRAKAMGKMS